MTRDRPMIVALTGGLASGKSTVARRFEELGVPVIEADDVARRLVEPGTQALAEIADTFGDDVLDTHGRLDRAVMRKLVFDNAGKRRRLECILHPRVRDAMRAFAASSDAPYVVFVIPLLVETNQAGEMDRVVVVDATRSLQAARAVARDGSPPATIAAMIDSQATRAERLAVADIVIENVGDIDTLRRRVDAVHRECQALAASWKSVKESSGERVPAGPPTNW